jgi:hypothetical protein
MRCSALVSSLVTPPGMVCPSHAALMSAASRMQRASVHGSVVVVVVGGLVLLVVVLLVVVLLVVDDVELEEVVVEVVVVTAAGQRTFATSVPIDVPLWSSGSRVTGYILPIAAPRPDSLGRPQGTRNPCGVMPEL